MTFVSETQPTGFADEMPHLHRELSEVNDLCSRPSGSDSNGPVLLGSDSESVLLECPLQPEIEHIDIVAALSYTATDRAFGDTGVSRITIPRLLAQQICEGCR